MNRYPVDALTRLTADIAHAVGLPREDAAIFAESLVHADLHGLATHGLVRLCVYVRRFRKGLVDLHAPLRVEHLRPAALSVDACNGVGQVQAVKVLRELMALAREYGVATAAIRHSQHFGTLSYYCNLAAAEGMILFATTNSYPIMAPTGGVDPFFGTNPLGIAFPTDKGFPACVDMATSKVAQGHIIEAAKQGKAIPGDWALDQDGHPTTDPAAALQGTMLPLAGYKGYALAFLVEALSGVLSGSAVGPGLGSLYRHMDRAQDVGHFFLVLDVGALMEPALFRQRMGTMIDAVKAGRRREDCEEIRVPGEGAHRRAADNRDKGVPVEERTLAEIRGLCAELGVAFSLEPTSAAD